MVTSLSTAAYTQAIGNTFEQFKKKTWYMDLRLTFKK